METLNERYNLNGLQIQSRTDFTGGIQHWFWLVIAILFLSTTTSSSSFLQMPRGRPPLDPDVKQQHREEALKRYSDKFVPISPFFCRELTAFCHAEMPTNSARQHDCECNSRFLNTLFSITQFPATKASRRHCKLRYLHATKVRLERGLGIGTLLRQVGWWFFF
jgi:hypothetical protein